MGCGFLHADAGSCRSLLPILVCQTATGLQDRQRACSFWHSYCSRTRRALVLTTGLMRQNQECRNPDGRMGPYIGCCRITLLVPLLGRNERTSGLIINLCSRPTQTLTGHSTSYLGTTIQSKVLHISLNCGVKCALVRMIMHEISFQIEFS